MSNNIKVSVVTPVYKEPIELIKRNIESVKSQVTKYDFEHIIIFDDPPHSILKYKELFEGDGEQYGDFCFIEHEENKGLPGARNSGIKSADGEYIMLLDADDMFVPGRIEKQIDFMEANGLDHCYGGYQEVHGNSSDPAEQVILPPEDPKEFLMDLNNVCYCGSNCFKRDLIHKVGLFDENLTGLGAEDMEYWLRISLSGAKVKGMKEVLYYLGIHGDNMTAKYVAGGQFVKAYDYIKRKYPNLKKP